MMIQKWLKISLITNSGKLRFIISIKLGGKMRQKASYDKFSLDRKSILDYKSVKSVKSFSKAKSSIE